MELGLLSSLLSLPVFLPRYYSTLEGLRGRHELTSVKNPERAMPVVTTRATSQNGGLATVRVGIAAPTSSGLAINAQQFHLAVLFPLDCWGT